MLDQTLRQLQNDPRFRDLTDDPRFQIDLRYASPANFIGRDMYGVFRRAYLHRDAAERLSNAADDLARRRPGHRFVIFDALRPRAIQRVLWDAVVGTANQPFIANPDKGSLHNFGLAIDLSIVDAAGTELDMGAGFDDFRDVAQPRFEARCAAAGEISAEQLNTRHLLRDVMHAAGFTQLEHEWWHFNAATLAEARARYVIIE